MDGEMENQDVLYDSLPEMSDIPVSLNPDTTVSTSINERNSVSSSLSSENSIMDEVSAGDKKKMPIKRCPCRDRVQWVWEDNSQSAFVHLVNDNMDVKFHKRQSDGTAVVRCTEPMAKNQYYWEVKMAYPVYGTDIMVGIGTSEANVKDVKNKFISGLGVDSRSWGYSYTGLFHHNGQRRYYAKSFAQGDTIGVHLDLWKGTLSFYKDRQHLGVASTGLKGKTLYAMASSTAARSGMRIIRSCSFPSSLQFLCCSKLRELIPDDQNVLDVINVPPGLKHFLHSKLSWLLSARCPEIDSQACSHSDYVNDDDDDDDDDDDEDTGLPDPYSIMGQYIIIGSALLGNLNGFQTLLTSQSRNPRIEENPLNLAKRRRLSHSDYDSE